MRTYGYVQQVIEDFWHSWDKMRVVSILPETYANANSARCAYRNAIKKLRYDIAIRMISGELYLIKVQNPNWTAKNYNKACFKCANRYPSKECAVCNNLSQYKEKHDD